MQMKNNHFFVVVVVDFYYLIRACPNTQIYNINKVVYFKYK